jgi:hypothetical protein
MFATIFWKAVLCHRQGLRGADGAAPSTFGCGTAALDSFKFKRWCDQVKFLDRGFFL